MQKNEGVQGQIPVELLRRIQQRLQISLCGIFLLCPIPRYRVFVHVRVEELPTRLPHLAERCYEDKSLMTHEFTYHCPSWAVGMSGAVVDKFFDGFVRVDDNHCAPKNIEIYDIACEVGGGISEGTS